MTTRRVEFYFDYISHNAFLAWVAIDTLRKDTDVFVEPIPVVFAGLLNAHGQAGPAEVPAKLRWMTRDVVRKARRLGLPLRPPASHPFNPLPSLRLTCAALEHHDPARAEALVSRLFEATWCESASVGEVETVLEIAASAGFDSDFLREQLDNPSIKAKLRANTDAAIARGVFGVPTLCIDDALFWGFDDLPNLRAYLDGDDPVADETFREWEAVSASAARR